MSQMANRPSRLSLSRPRENTWRRKKNEPARPAMPEAPRMGRPALPGGVLTLAGRVMLGILALALLAGLGVGLFESYTWLTEHPFFALRTISVTGNVRLSEEEVLSLAEVQPGVNSLAVNIREVEEKLLQNPWIESVSVARQFPDTLALEVKEKSPTFWMQSGEKLYYVDAAGRAIAPVDTNRFTSLPLLAVDQGGHGGSAASARPFVHAGQEDHALCHRTAGLDPAVQHRGGDVSGRPGPAAAPGQRGSAQRGLAAGAGLAGPEGTRGADQGGHGDRAGQPRVGDQKGVTAGGPGIFNKEKGEWPNQT